MTRVIRPASIGCFVLLLSIGTAGQTPPGAASSPTPQQVAAWKTMANENVDGMAKQIQVMVDSVFSFGELGFQEIETSRYLTGILEKNGFTVRRGMSNVPTAWVATWGQGKPVIS